MNQEDGSVIQARHRKVTYCRVMLIPSVLGTGEVETRRRFPGVCWPASLVNTSSCRLIVGAIWPLRVYTLTHKHKCIHVPEAGVGGERRERNILKLKQRKGKVQSNLKPRKRDPHERHGPQPVCTETWKGRGREGGGRKGGERRAGKGNGAGAAFSEE